MHLHQTLLNDLAASASGTVAPDFIGDLVNEVETFSPVAIVTLNAAQEAPQRKELFVPFHVFVLKKVRDRLKECVRNRVPGNALAHQVPRHGDKRSHCAPDFRIIGRVLSQRRVLFVLVIHGASSFFSRFTVTRHPYSVQQKTEVQP